MKKRIIFFGILLINSFVFAGGFRVSLQGVRQAGMGHTSAHTRDASVMFFNPAGISFIPEKLSVVAGGFGIKTETEFQDTNTFSSSKTDNKMSTPVYLAASYDITNDVTLGVSVTTPFGSSVKWGDNWIGGDLVRDIELRAIFIQPTVSFKFNEWFSAGVGYIIARGNIELNRSLQGISFADRSSSSLQLKNTDASGNGFNIGMYFKPTDKLDVSIAYRSLVNMEVKDGEANFNIPTSLAGTSTFPTTTDTFSATLPLSSEFTIGLSYKLTPKWLIAGDLNIAGWQSYKSLDIDFGQANVGNDVNDRTISRTPKNFKYSNIYRVGTEYSFTDKFQGRLGYYYDESPSPDANWSPETPSTDNHGITAGIGYKISKGLIIDANGGLIVGKERNVNNTAGLTGQVKSKATFFGVGLTYNPF